MEFINKKRLVDTFCALARIKSPSGQEEQISTFIIEKFSHLAKFFKDDYGNVIGKIAGNGKPIILYAHMDTVPVPDDVPITPILNDDRITSDGRTILGADNKDALAAILETLCVLKERGLTHRALEIVFAREEEAVSKGAKNLNISLLAGKECVVADAPAPLGTINISAPCCFKFETEIIGKRCHVAKPEDGVNASLIAARAITRIPLGRINELTTSNIAFSFTGLGGITDQKKLSELKNENRNSVPDLAVIFGEIRGADMKLIQETLKKIEDIFLQEAMALKGEARTAVTKLADGYLFEKTHPLITQIQRVFAAQNIEPRFHNSTGGSDANVLNGRGIASVCISSGHQNPHELSEFLMIKDLVKLADFYLKLVTEKQ